MRRPLRACSRFVLLSCLVAAPAIRAIASEPPVQPLVVDESYAPLLEDSGGGMVTAAVLRDDLSAVIGGTFEFVNDTAVRYLAALAPDGSLQKSFAAQGAPDGPVLALLGGDDGSVLVGGLFRTIGKIPAAGLARLRPDGALDDTFTVPTEVNGGINALARLADGSILVGGSFDTYAGSPAAGLVRLRADGSRDASFAAETGALQRHAEVLSIAALADGGCAVVVRHAASPLLALDAAGWPAARLPAPTTSLVRLQADGSLNPDFKLQRTTGLEPAIVAALPDGDLILAGSGEMQRLGPTGSVDGRFRFVEQGKMRVRAILPLSNGSILVGGQEWGNATLTARLLSVGPLGFVEARYVMPRDESHAFFALARNQRGRILAAGRLAPAAERLSFSKTENRVALLDEKLGVDRRFRAHVGASGQFTAAALDSFGLTLAGRFKSGEGLTGASVVRLQADGTPDRKFQPIGQLFGLPHILVPIPDGSVVLGGIVNTEIAIRTPRPVARLRSDGTPDPDFIPDVPVTGYFTDGILLRDGTVVLVGSLAGRTPDRSFADLIRFNLAGKVDRRLAEIVPSWLSSNEDRLVSVAETASGHLLVGGEFTRLQNYTRPAIARVGNIGVVDPTFEPATEEFAVVAHIMPLNDRRIFIDGWSTSGPEGRPIVRRFARLLPDGGRDNRYAPPPDFGAREPLLARVLADGTTLVVLQDLAPGARTRLRLARLDRNGSLLPDFDIALGNHANELRILPAADGAVYLVGDVPALDGAPRYGLARLVPGRN